MLTKLRNIYLLGMSGAGKSTVGKLLANSLMWGFVDVNETIEAIYGRTVKEIHSTFGEKSFKHMEATILQELSQGEHQVFACNCDSVLDKEKFRTMQNTGLTIWLEAPLANLLERIKQMTTPGLPADNSKRTLGKMLQERFPYYKNADIRINTGNISENDVADKILMVLKRFK